jgi:hypothetical protein
MQIIQRILKMPEWLFITLVIACYLSLVLPTALNHEMWRDEVQAWLIVRDSSSVTELYSHLRYEGHPGLWYLSLMLLQRLNLPLEAMQVWHACIGLAIAFIIVRHAPFSRIQRALLPLGYFFVYEYEVKCRGYSLGILAVLLICVLYKERFVKSTFIWIGILIALAANTSIMGLIIASSITIGITVEVIQLWLFSDGKKMPISILKLTVGYICILTGLSLSIIFSLPASDFAMDTETLLKPALYRIIDLLNYVSESYLHLFTASTFGAKRDILSNLIVSISWGTSVLAIAFFLHRLRNNLSIFAVYTLGSLGLLIFFYVKYSGAVWHHGHLFIILIISLWLYTLKEESKFPLISLERSPWSVCFTFILVSHFLWGASVSFRDIFWSYSNGKYAAQYIKSRGLEKRLLLIAPPDYASTALIGYLNKKSVFYLNGLRYGSFVKWDYARRGWNPSDNEVVKHFLGIDKNALLVMNHRIERDVISKYDISLLKGFSGAVADGENLYIYQKT